MILLAALILSMQSTMWVASPATTSVGDTVRLTRQLNLEAGAVLTAEPLVSTQAYQPLASPVVARSNGAVVVRYLLAFFETGRMAVSLPNLEITYPDGRIAVVSGDTAWIDVASVLPSGDTIPAPLEPLEPITRVQRSLLPAISLVVVAIVALTIWALRRRRVEPRPAWAGDVVTTVDPPLQQWIMAGELRTVVGALSERLRGEIAAVVPEAGRQLSIAECLAVIGAKRSDLPKRDIEEVLRALERALYAPAVPSDIALLVDQVDDIVSAIREQHDEERVS